MFITKYCIGLCIYDSVCIYDIVYTKGSESGACNEQSSSKSSTTAESDNLDRLGNSPENNSKETSKNDSNDLEETSKNNLDDLRECLESDLEHLKKKSIFKQYKELHNEKEVINEFIDEQLGTKDVIRLAEKLDKKLPEGLENKNTYITTLKKEYPYFFDEKNCNSLRDGLNKLKHYNNNELSALQSDLDQINAKLSNLSNPNKDELESSNKSESALDTDNKSLTKVRSEDANNNDNNINPKASSSSSKSSGPEKPSGNSGPSGDPGPSGDSGSSGDQEPSGNSGPSENLDSSNVSNNSGSLGSSKLSDDCSNFKENCSNSNNTSYLDILLLLVKSIFGDDHLD